MSLVFSLSSIMVSHVYMILGIDPSLTICLFLIKVGFIKRLFLMMFIAFMVNGNVIPLLYGVTSLFNDVPPLLYHDLHVYLVWCKVYSIMMKHLYCSKQVFRYEYETPKTLRKRLNIGMKYCFHNEQLHQLYNCIDWPKLGITSSIKTGMCKSGSAREVQILWSTSRSSFSQERTYGSYKGIGSNNIDANTICRVVLTQISKMK